MDDISGPPRGFALVSSLIGVMVLFSRLDEFDEFLRNHATVDLVEVVQRVFKVLRDLLWLC